MWYVYTHHTLSHSPAVSLFEFEQTLCSQSFSCFVDDGGSYYAEQIKRHTVREKLRVFLRLSFLSKTPARATHINHICKVCVCFEAKRTENQKSASSSSSSSNMCRMQSSIRTIRSFSPKTTSFHLALLRLSWYEVFKVVVTMFMRALLAGSSSYVPWRCFAAAIWSFRCVATTWVSWFWLVLDCCVVHADTTNTHTHTLGCTGFFFLQIVAYTYIYMFMVCCYQIPLV